MKIDNRKMDTCTQIIFIISETDEEESAKINEEVIKAENISGDNLMISLVRW